MYKAKKMYVMTLKGNDAMHKIKEIEKKNLM